MAKKTTTKRRAGRAKAPAPRIDLSSPKEKAVVDVLALAASADGEVSPEEMTLVVLQLQKLLGVPRSEALTEEIRRHVANTLAEMEKVGREAVFDRSVGQMVTAVEREALFALAASVIYVDKVVHLNEADFLVKLRTALGLSEATALAATAGVARTLWLGRGARHAGRSAAPPGQASGAG
jgi:uncharacterized membrane protein YebE (DUF533 family)